MTTENLGNILNTLVGNARAALFNQGELAQLTYGAFSVASEKVTALEQNEIQVSYPIGYKPDKTTIQSNRTYTKNDLLQRYSALANYQLSINGVIQLVTIVEAMLGDIVRSVLMKYPKKLGEKRMVSLQGVLEAHTLDEIKTRCVESLLNDLTYKSPAEFAETLKQYISVDLSDCPAFHKYIEIKAARDIVIHNRGVANDTYRRKAASHARVSSGKYLPVDVPYFLESYEFCLQLTEWIETELHELWHSSQYTARKTQVPPSAPIVPDKTPEKLPASNQVIKGKAKKVGSTKKPSATKRKRKK